MRGSKRKIAFLRYNPFSAIPPSTLLLTAVVGVVSGVYIFDDLVRSGAVQVTAKRNADEAESVRDGSTSS